MKCFLDLVFYFKKEFWRIFDLFVGGSGWVYTRPLYAFQEELVPLLLLLLLLLLHTIPYIYSLLLPACADYEQTAADVWNLWKIILAFLRLFLFDFSYVCKGIPKIALDVVFVRVPVGRGPLSTVKHICFVTMFLLNLTGPIWPSNVFLLLLLFE